MVSLQGTMSGMRRMVHALTSTRPGKDDFGGRSCAAFAISLVVLWLLGVAESIGETIVGTTAYHEPGLIRPLLMIVLFLGLLGTNLVGMLLGLAGIGRAIRERRIPLLSVVGFVLNVGPSGFLLAIFLVRA